MMSEENPLAAASGMIACPSCGAQLPSVLRFCRQCGYRLGEGVAEYTATEMLPDVQTNGKNRAARPPFAASEQATAAMPPRAFDPARFDNMQREGGAPTNPAAPHTANPERNFNDYFTPFTPVNPVAPLMPQQNFIPAAQWQTKGLGWKGGKSKPWLFWVIISILFFGAISTLHKNRTRTGGTSGSSRVVASGSWMGMDFKTVDGKPTIRQIEIPGSPADQAGLVGGDIITGINGQPVNNAADAVKLFAQIPVGATAAVTFIRDGASLATTITAQGEETLRNLERAFDRQEQGKWGIDDDDFERVTVMLPGNQAIYGIQLGEPNVNDPAYLAGLKEGDIVIAYDGVPIRTGEELVRRIRRTKPLEAVPVRIIRNGTIMDILVKAGKR